MRNSKSSREEDGGTRTIEGICEESEELYQRAVERARSVLSEFGEFLIYHSDRTYLNGVQCEHSKSERKVMDTISRIEEHAAYFREHGEIRYKFGGQFLTSEEVRALIVSHMGSEYCSNGNIRFFASVVDQLDEWQGSISTRQVIAIENILGHIQRQRSLVESGVIFYDPGGDSSPNCAYVFGMRIVNFVLGRGRKLQRLSTADVLRCKEMLMGEDGSVDLTPVKSQLRQLVRKDRIFRQYRTASRLLGNYLNAIDAEKHEINGLYSARPKISS